MYIFLNIHTYIYLTHSLLSLMHNVYIFRASHSVLDNQLVWSSLEKSISLTLSIPIGLSPQELSPFTLVCLVLFLFGACLGSHLWHT